MLKKLKLKKQYGSLFCDIFIIGSILIGGPPLATPMVGLEVLMKVALRANRWKGE